MKENNMPLTFVTGDPLLTKAAVLAIGHNAKGRTEMDDFAMTLMREYPAAFSTYTRLARTGRQKGGDLYIWSEAKPRLLFLTVRDSSVGATRLRYVQKALISIARDYTLYNMPSLAIARLGNHYERSEIEALYNIWLKQTTLPVIVYQAYQAGVAAEESL
jgi:hypothetical protein